MYTCTVRGRATFLRSPSLGPTAVLRPCIGTVHDVYVHTRLARAPGDARALAAKLADLRNVPFIVHSTLPSFVLSSEAYAPTMCPYPRARGCPAGTSGRRGTPEDLSHTLRKIHRRSAAQWAYGVEGAPLSPRRRRQALPPASASCFLHAWSSRRNERASACDVSSSSVRCSTHSRVSARAFRSSCGRQRGGRVRIERDGGGKREESGEG